MAHPFSPDSTSSSASFVHFSHDCLYHKAVADSQCSPAHVAAHDEPTDSIRRRLAHLWHDFFVAQGEGNRVETLRCLDAIDALKPTYIACVKAADAIKANAMHAGSVMNEYALKGADPLEPLMQQARRGAIDTEDAFLVACRDFFSRYDSSADSMPGKFMLALEALHTAQLALFYDPSRWDEFQRCHRTIQSLEEEFDQYIDAHGGDILPGQQLSFNARFRAAVFRRAGLK